jgi:hypothetical protein
MPARCKSSDSRCARLADAIGQIEWTLSAFRYVCHARLTTRACDTPVTVSIGIKLLPNESEKRFMNGEQKDSLGITRMQPASADARESGNRSVQDRVAQLACERVGNLPVWIRAPKHGHEFYSGCSRAKLYEWAAKGFIRSVSIREPGQIKGVRLFHLASIFAFFERCEAGAFTEETNRQTR